MTPTRPPFEQCVAPTARRVFLQRQAESARARAFSLVEVTLALGIMGFAFVSILGLVPLGLSSFLETKNVNVSSQIAQQIFAEVQNTTFAELTDNLQPGQSWRLPPPGSSTQVDPNGPSTVAPLRCFDEQGQELSSTDTAAIASAVYRVNVRVAVSTPFVQNSTATSTLAPNPALANVAIQIAYNPANLPMTAATSDPYFWTGKSGTTTIPTITYETLVARNF